MRRLPEVTLVIGGFRYPMTCRDGEQDHFLALASAVDAKVTEARAALGGISEVRQLLFAALLLADAVKDCEARLSVAEARFPDADQHSFDVEGLERLAARVEMIASRLENRAGTP
jgi:cell division protein ZapA